jgi:hypothetical protein
MLWMRGEKCMFVGKLMRASEDRLEMGHLATDRLVTEVSSGRQMIQRRPGL